MINRFSIIATIFLSSCFHVDNKVDNSIVTDSSQVLSSAKYNVLSNIKIDQGVDTLEKVLRHQDYKPQLFDSFHTLTYAYIYLSSIEKADSVFNLIKREGLNENQDILWLCDAYLINIERGRYDKALTNLNQIYHHSLSKTSLKNRTSYFFYEKWYLYSQIKECDSAKYYLNSYILTLKTNPANAEIQNIDTVKMKHFENISKQDCPLVDSASQQIRRIIPYSW